MDEPTYHLEELEAAAQAGRPVNWSSYCRFDHLEHKIPLGALVAVDVTVQVHSSNGASGELKGRLKLFVVVQHRDCDGTPLYGVADICVRPPEQTFSPLYNLYMSIANVYEHGYSEDALSWEGDWREIITMEDYLRLLSPRR